MNSSIANGGTLLNHLLAHHLAQNETIPLALPFVLGILTSSRAVQRCEVEEGIGGPIMKRWTSRIQSLIKLTMLSPIRLAGFQLVHLTFTASTDALLRDSKDSLAAGLNVLEANQDPILFVAALEVIQLILARSLWHAEWARETIGAAMIQRTVKSLVKAANSVSDEVKIPSVNAIVSLIPLFPTPLRPIYTSLHDLAIALICDLSESPSIIEAGASLMVSLYLIAKNGKDGLRDAWRLTAEGIAGSMDILIGAVTSDVFAEDPLTNYTLSPFKLPPLADASPMSALSRLEALSQALCLTLRTPTSERTGPIDIPVGALVELGVRLVGMSTDMPVKERTDPTTLTLTLSLLPRLQIVGCQLLAQLALATGSRLVANASVILGTIARTLTTYALRSPMRSTLATSYSIILSALGAAIDPEEGKKSLARVWRCVLEDIGSIAVEPINAVASENDKSRKNKRQKTYDPTESMALAGRRVRIDEIDLAIAEQSLSTLARLLSAPHSHFLPPKLLLSTSRLLLCLSLSPHFFVAQSSSACSSTYFNATSAAQGVDIACQSAEFRRGVVRCLKALITTGGGAQGLVDRAVEVWRRGSIDRDDEIKQISIDALISFSALIHPVLPPLQINSTFARLKAERVGGTVGDSIDLEEGAQEFAAVEEEEKDALQAEDEGMEVDEEPQENEEVAKMVEMKNTSEFPKSSFPTFTASSTFTSTSITTSIATKPAVMVAPSSFIVAPVRPAAVVKKVEAITVGSDDEDDDEAMPIIDMGSDDEDEE